MDLSECRSDRSRCGCQTSSEPGCRRVNLAVRVGGGLHARGSEIEQHLQAMNPYDLQALVASLLRAMGYYVSWVSPPGKDGGIDILAWGDPLGTRPPRIKVQVKRRTEAVSVEGLRAFMALLSDDEVGIFVSTGGFTKDQELARSQERQQAHPGRPKALLPLRSGGRCSIAKCSMPGRSPRSYSLPRLSLRRRTGTAGGCVNWLEQDPKKAVEGAPDQEKAQALLRLQIS